MEDIKNVNIKCSLYVYNLPNEYTLFVIDNQKFMEFEVLDNTNFPCVEARTPKKK